MVYKHLVIIGNGFDRACGLQTALSSYEKYFSSHYERVMAEEGIDSVDGKSPFHVTYGNSLISQQHDFWAAYEENLGRPDFRNLRLKPVCEQERCLRDTKRLSDIVFRNWIADTYEKGCGSCWRGTVESEAFFLNFNYTPTLQEGFCADDNQVHHLHGSLRKGTKIIVGHNVGARTRPKKEWYDDSEPGQRCFIEDTYLYDTDKKSNWVKLQMTTSNVGQLSANAKTVVGKKPLETHGIKQVIVLGHSINEIDMTYFTYIHNKVRMNRPKWMVSCYSDDDRVNAIRLKRKLQLPSDCLELAALRDAAASVIEFG